MLRPRTRRVISDFEFGAFFNEGLKLEILSWEQKNAINILLVVFIFASFIYGTRYWLPLVFSAFRHPQKQAYLRKSLIGFGSFVFFIIFAILVSFLWSSKIDPDIALSKLSDDRHLAIYNRPHSGVQLNLRLKFLPSTDLLGTSEFDDAKPTLRKKTRWWKAIFGFPALVLCLQENIVLIWLRWYKAKVAELPHLSAEACAFRSSYSAAYKSKGSITFVSGMKFGDARFNIPGLNLLSRRPNYS